MNLRFHPAFLLLVAAVVLFIGFRLGISWNAGLDPGHAEHAGGESSAAAHREVLYWYDPMVPNQRFDKPGKSPFMDMDLVPRYADEAAQAQVRIDPGVQQNLGIRTSEVKAGHLESDITVPGTLTWDLRHEAVVAARVEGLVERVDVRAPFTAVRRGQRLALMRAPQWSSAAAETRALDAAQSPAARSLRDASRQRLRALGLPGNASGSGTLALLAPHDGVVSEVLVREGETVAAGAPLFRVARLDTLWLEAAIPQADAARLAAGLAVEARVDARPGEVFAGHVESLLPQVDAASRTQPARIVLDNQDGRLAPGMFARVTLIPPAGPRVALIPTDALVSTGSDSRVIVQRHDGSFAPVRVQPGRSAGGTTEILSGLAEGDRVVTSGQFLIDSEASLSGALERLATPSPDHSTMDHSTMDHSTMDHSTMDHSAMDHSTMDHSAMDHSAMDHSSHRANPALQPGAVERDDAQGHVDHVDHVDHANHGKDPTP